MDPQSEKAPGLRLPQPSSFEGRSSYGRYEDIPIQKQEISPEVKVDPASSAPATNDTVGVPTLPATTTDDLNAAPDGSQSQQATSSAGDDTDELDKEWVNKAKFIVEQTKSDPYTQSKEIGKAKADYLRIRYNKHIKVGQDQTL